MMLKFYSLVLLLFCLFGCSKNEKLKEDVFLYSDECLIKFKIYSSLNENLVLEDSHDCNYSLKTHFLLTVGNYYIEVDHNNSKIKKSFSVALNRDNSIYLESKDFLNK